MNNPKVRKIAKRVDTASSKRLETCAVHLQRDEKSASAPAFDCAEVTNGIVINCKTTISDKTLSQYKRVGRK